jgi:hypothetical protein
MPPEISEELRCDRMLVSTTALQKGHEVVVGPVSAHRWFRSWARPLREPALSSPDSHPDRSGSCRQIRGPAGEQSLTGRNQPEEAPCGGVAENMGRHPFPLQRRAAMPRDIHMFEQHVLDCVGAESPSSRACEHVTIRATPCSSDHVLTTATVNWTSGVHFSFRPFPRQRTWGPWHRLTSPERRQSSPVQVFASGAASSASVSGLVRNPTSFWLCFLLSNARTRWMTPDRMGSSKAAYRKKDRMAVRRRLRLRGVCGGFAQRHPRTRR